jgi:hypothetical protein
MHSAITNVGTSAHAVGIQVWTALIAMLILRLLLLSSQSKWSLSNLVALLRRNFFTHRQRGGLKQVDNLYSLWKVRIFLTAELFGL